MDLVNRVVGALPGGASGFGKSWGLKQFSEKVIEYHETWSPMGTAPRDGTHIRVFVMSPMTDMESSRTKNTGYETILYWCESEWVTYPYSTQTIEPSRCVGWLPCASTPSTERIKMKFKNDIDALQVIEKNFYVYRLCIYPKTDSSITTSIAQAAIDYLVEDWNYGVSNTSWESVKQANRDLES